MAGRHLGWGPGAGCRPRGRRPRSRPGEGDQIAWYVAFSVLAILVWPAALGCGEPPMAVVWKSAATVRGEAADRKIGTTRGMPLTTAALRSLIAVLDAAACAGSISAISVGAIRGGSRPANQAGALALAHRRM